MSGLELPKLATNIKQALIFSWTSINPKPIREIFCSISNNNQLDRQIMLPVIAIIFSATSLLISFFSAYRTFFYVKRSLRAVIISDPLRARPYIGPYSGSFHADIVFINDGNQTTTVLSAKLSVIPIVGGKISGQPEGPFIIKFSDSVSIQVVAPVSNTQNYQHIPESGANIYVDFTCVNSDGVFVSKSISIATIKRAGDIDQPATAFEFVDGGTVSTKIV